MANKRQKIEFEVEKTLEAFDQTPQLSASPWFATRVQNRINAAQEATPSRANLLGSLGLLRPALLVLVVALNMATAFVAFQRSNQTVDSHEEYVSSFASEYGYTDSDALFTLE